ncbi:anti-CBASS protein Acb1 family protein [Commensalibacter nepenthis]|uniref:DUF1073 domain-containing protein n=1 Tax=Commensalibacter nepenthis TaxID=3043872 RepID=A0ABT6Q834_9PROT|nr:anti-CBASS Acb1 family protein [Commensalibacter sp. TBRC 10068]MDI2113060.1 DUF1073 domain-containing protein [Commensalibacter sp. TBRC 10068]
MQSNNDMSGFACLNRVFNKTFHNPNYMNPDYLSYDLCKQLYVYHPLGKRIVDLPIDLTLNKDRILNVKHELSPELLEQFNKKWKELNLTRVIRNLAVTSRLYGIAALFIKADGVEDNKKIPDDKTLNNYKITPLVYDALNIAGSATGNQNIDSVDFLELKDVYRSGTALAKDRSIILSNGDPIYIEYINSAYGYAGRSVFQNCAGLLQSYLDVMEADNTVARKVALIVAKLNQGGSATRVQEAANDQKRNLLQEARNDNVLSIGTNEDIDTLNMTNVDNSLDTSRRHIIEDIANAIDLPVILLNGQKFTGGFGEGSEDTKNIGRHIDNKRQWLEPIFDFCDNLVMELAWDFNFIDSLNSKNSSFYDKNLTSFEEKQRLYKVKFQELKNSFSYSFPSFLTETEAEILDGDVKKINSMKTIFESVYDKVDPQTKSQLICWMMDNFNDLRSVNKVKIDYNPDEIKEFIEINGADDLINRLTNGNKQEQSNDTA